MNYSSTLPTSETLGQKINRCVRKQLNSIPLILPSAWAISTDYTGQEGVVVTNGGNMYQLMVAGTSAGFGGPTGTDEKVLVTDNGCKWFYIGKTNPASSSIDIPTITQFNGATPSGMTLYKDGVSDPNLLYMKFVSANYVITDATRTYSVDNTRGANKTGNVVNGSGGTQGLGSSGQRIIIETDSPSIGVTFEYPKLCRVWVDDVPLWHGNVLCGTGTGACGFKLSWTGTSNRKRRKIEIQIPAGASFRRIYYEDYSELYSLGTQDDIKMVGIGDSFLEGGNGFPLVANDNWLSLAGRKLGFSHVVCSGIGGTGISTVGSNVAYTSRVLVDGLGINRNIPSGYTQLGTFKSTDILVICGSVNDINAGTLATDTLALYNQIRQNFSGIIIWVGIVTNPNNGATGASTYEKIMFDALPTGDSLLYLIPISDITRIDTRWTSGSGRSGLGSSGTSNVLAGSNSVNISSDNVHLSHWGIEYMSNRFVQAFKSLVMPTLR